ncbi:hypothetical protein RCCS2_15239 [Roseobacter sp. CCS2]|nr:hypothetical protein RCCS2_15239 [Roseobacter sp. CCS2]
MDIDMPFLYFTIQAPVTQAATDKTSISMVVDDVLFVVPIFLQGLNTIKKRFRDNWFMYPTIHAVGAFQINGAIIKTVTKYVFYTIFCDGFPMTVAQTASFKLTDEASQ